MTTVIIPARGGSKGIPRKNLVDLCGQPLVRWTIDVARQIGVKPYVSTEDKEIAEYCIDYGSYIIKRPDALAEDNVHSIYAILHAIKWLSLSDHEIVVMLLPTSPLRLPSHVTDCVRMTSPQNSVVSIVEGPPLNSHRHIDDTGRLKTVLPIFDTDLQRQDFAQDYYVNGSIFCSTVGRLKKYHTFHSPGVFGYIMSKLNSIDINTQEDLILARRIIRDYSEKE